MNIVYYTDGACQSNGNLNSKGGYGIVCINSNLQITDPDFIIWEYQDFKAPTTNNEMELMAILTALQHIQQNNYFIKPVIYSDSAYCVNLINNWMYNWERNGWKRSRDQEVKNLEIIKQIFELAYLADIKKINGHCGIIGNEIADQLATGERKAKKF